eukprot:sb/3478628/
MHCIEISNAHYSSRSRFHLQEITKYRDRDSRENKLRRILDSSLHSKYLEITASLVSTQWTVAKFKPNGTEKSQVFDMRCRSLVRAFSTPPLSDTSSQV